MLGDVTKSMLRKRGHPAFPRIGDRPREACPRFLELRDVPLSAGNDADDPPPPKPFGRGELRPQAVSLVVADGRASPSSSLLACGRNSQARGHVGYWNRLLKDRNDGELT